MKMFKSSKQLGRSTSLSSQASRARGYSINKRRGTNGASKRSSPYSNKRY